MKILGIYASLYLALVSVSLAGTNELNNGMLHGTNAILSRLRTQEVYLESRDPLALEVLLLIVGRQAQCKIYFGLSEVTAAQILPCDEAVTNSLSLTVNTNSGSILIDKVCLTGQTAIAVLNDIAKKAGLGLEVGDQGVFVNWPSTEYWLNVSMNSRQAPVTPDRKPPTTPPAIANILSRPPVVLDKAEYRCMAIDHVGRKRKPSEESLANDSIYLIPEERMQTSNYFDSAQLVSSVGYRKHPVWNKQGSQIAYIDFSKGSENGRVVILDVTSGEERTFDDIYAQGPISWDESGSLIAFKGIANTLCVLNTQDGTVRPVCVTDSKIFILSPDGRSICLMENKKAEGSLVANIALQMVDVQTGDSRMIDTAGASLKLCGPFFWREGTNAVAFFGLEPQSNDQKPKLYSYQVETGAITPQSNWDFYRQDHRYWDMPPIPSVDVELQGATSP